MVNKSVIMPLLWERVTFGGVEYPWQNPEQMTKNSYLPYQPRLAARHILDQRRATFHQEPCHPSVEQPAVRFVANSNGGWFGVCVFTERVE